ncbi:universal stress protein [Amaricoccus macauensis]|uniref:universal stress protein n=1 Tax=Amaricoccus macauensis TaxID=57001 RepID=UPI003C7C62FD
MLPEIHDILFATDLSPNADNALCHALSMAMAHGARVHVLHVAEPMSREAIVTLELFVQDETSRNRALKDRHATLRQNLKKNQQAFLKSLPPEEKEAYATVASVELDEGHAAETILRRARELKCNLIVMGTHEQDTSNTYIGTVVRQVQRRSPIPTLIVPHKA